MPLPSEGVGGREVHVGGWPWHDAAYDALAPFHKEVEGSAYVEDAASSCEGLSRFYHAVASSSCAASCVLEEAVGDEGVGTQTSWHRRHQQVELEVGCDYCGWHCYWC